MGIFVTDDGGGGSHLLLGFGRIGFDFAAAIVTVPIGQLLPGPRGRVPSDRVLLGTAPRGFSLLQHAAC